MTFMTSCVSGIIACEQALCFWTGIKKIARRGIPFALLAIFSPFPQTESLFTGYCGSGIIALKAGFLATKKRSTTVIARLHYKDMLLLNHDKVMFK